MESDRTQGPQHTCTLLTQQLGVRWDALLCPLWHEAPISTSVSTPETVMWAPATASGA